MLRRGRTSGVADEGRDGDGGSGAWGALLGLVGILLLALAAMDQSVSAVRSTSANGSAGLAAASGDTLPVDPGNPIALAGRVERAGSSPGGTPGAAPAPANPGTPDTSGLAASSATPSSADTASTSESAETLAAALEDEYPLQENPLSGCPLCHVDIEDEFVGSVHFKEKVGCITCHGPSQGHLADENNEVKPNEIFARADVNRLCQRCHECFRPKPDTPELTADGQRKVCIDCHGSHDVALANEQ